MRICSLVGLVLLAAGCKESKGEDTHAPTETTPPTDTETSAGVTVSDVTWQLHAEFGSLVEVAWSQSEAGTAWVEFSVDDGEWRSSPPVEVAAGQGTALLLGVPYDWDVDFVVHVDTGSSTATSDTFTARTGAVPRGGGVPEVLSSDPDQWSAEFQYVLYSNSSTLTAILDRQARVVWMYANTNAGGALMPRVSTAGTELLIDHNTYWWVWDGGAGSEVIRMKIDGSQREDIPTPGLHHAFTDLADGTILYSATEGLTESLVQLDPDGTSHTLWQCASFTDEVGGSPYCGSNTIWYNAPTDTVFYSLYSHDTILEIDRQTGEALRRFGDAEGSWAFDPPESAFWWQHGVSILDSGNLITSSQAEEDSIECVVREYELDFGAETLREVWSFAGGPDVTSTAMGEAHRLADGTTLHNTGAGGRFIEVSPEGDVVWDLYWPGIELGRTTPIADLYDFAP
jgi:hypothetical protein